MLRKFGLIGYPLSHSFSKAYFTEKFHRLQLTDNVYENYALENLNAFLPLIKSDAAIQGLNVTIPYKIEIIPFLNKLNEEAEKVGAVNTIKIEKKNDDLILTGFNTDVYGFEKSIKPFLKNIHNKALILGNGGAARAVKYVCEKMGIDFLIVSRNPSAPNAINYSQLNEYIFKSFLFIVNTTPLGMFPHPETYPPIPFEFITSDHLMMDLVYNPEDTEFMKKGKAKGATVLNGKNMLHLQAEKSWEIWNTK